MLIPVRSDSDDQNNLVDGNNSILGSEPREFIDSYSLWINSLKNKISGNELVNPVFTPKSDTALKKFGTFLKAIGFVDADDKVIFNLIFKLIIKAFLSSR